ncbi:AAA family ATPase [Propionivibrio sp.]|uniref:AAA family ATPase n=1 Tax=Propionivibrio sp. TaxID=2212460 RepID=UPI003BEFB77B
MSNDIDRARDALQSLDPNCDRDAWVKRGMAYHAAGGDFDTFDQWSAGAGNYTAAGARDAWRSFKDTQGGVTAGALFGMARDAGWTEGTDRKPAPKKATRAAEPPRKPMPGNSAPEVWNRLVPVLVHQYKATKGATGAPNENLRMVPTDSTLTIAMQSLAGALAVPAYAPDGTMQSIQFIPVPGKGKKLNLPGASMSGAWFTVGTIKPGEPVYLCEGIGTAWACWMATGAAAVVCFGWGNIDKVAKQLRQSDASARLVLCPDVGKETAADKIAAEVGAGVAKMPDGWKDNSDLNDLFQSPNGGFDAVQQVLESASEPPKPEQQYPVSLVFADELSDTFEPPDELVEGLITAGDGSVLYGDSNSGKTFLVIDLAAAVGRGVPWLGRRTEQGMVVYLAAESVGSVRTRLQAYQKHHGCLVPNFAIVQSPIDLFDGNADTKRVIDLVRVLEQQRGQKVRLIVGDTLARLSAGANENAGQDMGMVISRFDRIRTECKAHFMLIHHCGKNAANGSRGWSGIRASIDTELEVTDNPAGRCLEITKQRDLGTKGERIGFRLDSVVMGETKWGKPATSCIVVPVDAPVKVCKAIKLGETQQAVMALLRGAGRDMRIKEIAEKLADQDIGKTSVYNAVNRLRDVELVEVSGGIVHLIGGKP